MTKREEVTSERKCIKTFPWVIGNFSTKQSVLISPSFQLHHNNVTYSFNLQFYPRGISSFWNEKQMILYLWLDSVEQPVDQPTNVVKVRNTVFVVNGDGVRCNVQDGIAEFTDINTHKTMKQNWLYMLSREYVMDQLLVDNNFTIHCEVQLIDFCDASQFEDKPLKILEDFQSLLHSGEFADIKIKVGPLASEGNGNDNRREFSAHKAILAVRSPVFAAMFRHEKSAESLSNQIDIPDIDEDVFEEMLRFIYSGKVTRIEQFASELMIAADKYQMESLKLICEDYLCGLVTTESASDLLLIADRHNVSKLRTYCVDHLSRNASDVKNTEGWARLTKQRPELVIDLFLRLAEIKN